MRFFCMLLVVLVSSTALAQERSWEIREHRVIDADHVVLDVPASTDGAPTRIRIRGTLDSSIDGSELDAVVLRRGGAADLGVGPPLVLSLGARVVEADEVAHRYVVEAAPGTPIHATLAIARMAGAHLVTATEMRMALHGVMDVDVMGRSAIAISPEAPLAPTETSGVGAGLLAAALTAIGFWVLRRREPHEARLLRRARRAREAIAARARILGPALAGVVAPAERLEAAIRAARRHLGSIDAALAATRWMEGPAARAYIDGLATRRDGVRADLERMTGELEAALVRLASLETERHAETEGVAITARMRAEVDIAEDVEREVARL